MNTSVSNFSREIGAQLKFAGIDDYPIESRQLISYCMDWTQTQYLSSLNLPIDDGKRKRIEALVKRRISREPIQYILGSASFYGRTFSVNPNVLIPRPETELLVEQIIKFVKETNLKEPKILDICTGSGIIAISLAKELPSSNVTATDISEEAIEVAKLNALRRTVLQVFTDYNFRLYFTVKSPYNNITHEVSRSFLSSPQLELSNSLIDE